MKLIYGGVPYNTLKVKHFEIDTNSADVQPSDMQAGVTAYARGQKVTGTGKAFEFAIYGDFMSNSRIPLPNIVNTIQLSSITYPIQQTKTFEVARNTDFTAEQVIGEIVTDGTVYPINIQINNNILMLTCDLTIDIQLFLGKDNYV